MKKTKSKVKKAKATTRRKAWRRVRRRSARRRQLLMRHKHDGSMWIPLRVQDIATDKNLRAAVRRHLHAWVDWKGPVKKRRGNPLVLCLRAPEREPVRATIRIGAYLTVDCPERLRERVVEIRSEGDALCVAASMYLAVYRANERAGGEPAIVTEEDVRRRLRRRASRARRVRGKEGAMVRMFSTLQNRGFNPYVWGHDLSDLVFESIHMRWTGPRSVVVTFGIGS